MGKDYLVMPAFCWDQAFWKLFWLFCWALTGARPMAYSLSRTTDRRRSLRRDGLVDPAGAGVAPRLGPQAAAW